VALQLRRAPVRMPFGDPNPFWCRDYCPHCGGGRLVFAVARRERVGRWPWQRAWVTRGRAIVDTRPDPRVQ
jgi:hypothetical protein